LTLGVRLEWNTFGKFQPEPTARLLFLPTERQSVWAAISRAARNPTRSDTQNSFNTHFAPPNIPIFLNLRGNPDIEAENLVAYEIGYRAAPTDYFSWDIAGYINDYNKLISAQSSGPPVLVPPGFIVFPATFENNVQALTYGFETTGTYTVNDQWRLFASYSMWQFQGKGPPDDIFTIPALAGSSPKNMVYLRSSWDIGSDVQFDLIGRYVDSLAALDVPKYFQMDTRIGWQATKSMEVSFVGQNLLDGHHLEFQSFGFPVTTEVRRSWYGMLTWTY
jgi:iron complex outermembrane receptor protein